MKRQITIGFGALLIFIVVESPLKCQPPSKSPESALKTGTRRGAFPHATNEGEGASERGAEPKLGVRPETSRWAGYFSQPGGRPYKWYFIRLELTEDEGGQVSGKCLVGPLMMSRSARPPLSRPAKQPLRQQEYILTKVKGERRDKELRFKDVEVLEKTKFNGGAGIWFTNRSFIGKSGSYGALLGRWSDAKWAIKREAEGEIFLVRMDYHIVIQRQEDADGVTRSTLSVNGSALGDVYEDSKKLIPGGVYPGRRLYVASKAIVQSGERRLGTKGDFLLEILKVPKRKDVFILPGDKATKGADGVLAGAAAKKGDAWLAPPVLAALRWHFYCTDNTIPLDPFYVQKEQHMRIEVRDAPKGVEPRPAMKVSESSLPAPLTRPIQLLEMIPKK